MYVCITFLQIAPAFECMYVYMRGKFVGHLQDGYMPKEYVFLEQLRDCWSVSVRLIVFHTYISISIDVSLSLSLYIYIYIGVCVCVYVCMYVCILCQRVIYIYIYIYSVFFCIHPTYFNVGP